MRSRPGIAVAAQGVGYVTVVAGVVHCSLEHAVEEQGAGFLVDLVLDCRAVHGDFDDDVDVVGDVAPDGNILQAHGRLRPRLEGLPL
jgi:hypothetical protein